MFQDAVKVKLENDIVLVSGDSGALAYFLNKEKWQPFTYVVAVVENDEYFDSTKIHIYLKLVYAFKSGALRMVVNVSPSLLITSIFGNEGR